MKMNFKYLMLASALLMGFASCSNDEEVTDGLLPNGELTMARFTLTQSGTVTRAASTAPTDAEKLIKTAKLYVFTATQTLEKVVDFNTLGDNGFSGAATSQAVEVTSGGHFFLAAVNAPAITGITTGMSLTSVESRIAEVAAMSAITDPNFFMTNISGAVTGNMAEGKTADAPNVVDIEVGRAMAKVNVACTGGGAYNALTGEKGKLTGIKYVTANNPKKMYYFPVLSGNVYTSPYFTDYVATADYPTDAATVRAKYFPNLTATTDFSALVPAAKSPFDTNEAASASYLMENANQTPRKGTSSYLLLQGKYEPVKWVNGVNVETTAAADGTFWRLYNRDTDQYYSSYINVADAADIDVSKFTTDDASKINKIKYEGGICYYAFYLENKTNTVDSKFTVKRNVYYDVELDKVLSAGSSLPNIEGNGEEDDNYIPGTGGGDGGGNNEETGGGEEPIDENTFVKGTITVKDWSVVSQTGGIGY